MAKWACLLLTQARARVEVRLGVLWLPGEEQVWLQSLLTIVFGVLSGRCSPGV
jgi:hypothetical protein